MHLSSVLVFQVCDFPHYHDQSVPNHLMCRWQEHRVWTQHASEESTGSSTYWLCSLPLSHLAPQTSVPPCMTWRKQYLHPQVVERNKWNVSQTVLFTRQCWSYHSGITAKCLGWAILSTGDLSRRFLCNEASAEVLKNIKCSKTGLLNRILTGHDCCSTWETDAPVARMVSFQRQSTDVGCRNSPLSRADHVSGASTMDARLRRWMS